MRAEQGEGRKKKGKRGTTVPLSELGFKAKIYYGIETEYTRRRVKYKAARYGAENSRECFMGRLTFTLDANALSQEDLEAIAAFSPLKKHEWEKVRLITYHSREELACAICLEKQFCAPQMTHCGHVFCWPCLYMHHFKSLKANNCPVCNELYAIDALVSCRPLCGRAFPELDQNRIRLALKRRPEGEKRVFGADLKEDLRFARVVKATTEKILELFGAEREELERFLKECDDEETRGWVAKVISLAYDKIDRAGLHGKRQYRLHRNETRVDGYVVAALDERTPINFYQEHSGRLIFLHPLCDKFLRACGKELPEEIEEEIAGWEEVEYNVDLARRYKQLHHLVINQEIDLVTIDLRRFLSEEQQRQFEAELEQCRTRKQDELEREEREAERLQAKYEQEKQYIKKLKKMEESEFYDIRVPTTIDPRELGDNAYFPSLIQTKSQPDPTTTLPLPKQPEKREPAPLITETDFPGLVLAPKVEAEEEPPKLVASKSEQPKTASGQGQGEETEFPGLGSWKQAEEPKFQKKASRKKKEKFVNVTEQFFQRREDD